MTFIKDEQNQNLQKALKKLKKEYSDVLYLIYFEEMSYEEAGIILKKSSKQIKNSVFRAKNVLKEIMLKEGFQYEEL